MKQDEYVEKYINKRLKDYGSGQVFSSFKRIGQYTMAIRDCGGATIKTTFPRMVYSYLRDNQRFSSIKSFIDDNTYLVMLNGVNRMHYANYEHREIFYDETDLHRALEIWHFMRYEILGVPMPSCFSVRTTVIDSPAFRRAIGLPTISNQSLNGEYEMNLDEEATIEVNADRNEMVALLQHAKGAQFVRLSFTDKNSAKAETLIYKAVDLNLEVGEWVVVPMGKRFQVMYVIEVLADVPSSSQYDYKRQLRHVIQKVDMVRHNKLEDLDDRMLRRITASEASDRIEALTRRLGISLDKISLSLEDNSTI